MYKNRKETFCKKIEIRKELSKNDEGNTDRNSKETFSKKIGRKLFVKK